VTGLVLLTAAGTGVGLWLIAVGLFPRPPGLRRALQALDAAREPAAQHRPAAAAGGWTARVGRRAGEWLLRAGLPTRGTRRDLATIGKPIAVHLPSRPRPQ